MADEPEQVSKAETAILLSLADSTLGLDGDFVELGCYRGDTSLLLQKLLIAKDGLTKRLFIYDSFAGLPKRSLEDSSAAGEAFSEGELFVTKREVVEKFKKAGVRLPVIKKGFFEDLTDDDLPDLISFAFLDGDLYTSIKTSLAIVFPRLVSGGIMIVHDYNNPQLPGSAKAVDEFLRAHPEFRLEVRETLAIMRG